MHGIYLHGNVVYTVCMCGSDKGLHSVEPPAHYPYMHSSVQIHHLFAWTQIR